MKTLECCGSKYSPLQILVILLASRRVCWQLINSAQQCPTSNEHKTPSNHIGHPPVLSNAHWEIIAGEQFHLVGWQIHEVMLATGPSKESQSFEITSSGYVMQAFKYFKKAHMRFALRHTWYTASSIIWRASSESLRVSTRSQLPVSSSENSSLYHEVVTLGFAPPSDSRWWNTSICSTTSTHGQSLMHRQLSGADIVLRTLHGFRPSIATIQKCYSTTVAAESHACWSFI